VVANHTEKVTEALRRPHYADHRCRWPREAQNHRFLIGRVPKDASCNHADLLARKFRKPGWVGQRPRDRCIDKDQLCIVHQWQPHRLDFDFPSTL
jgi:hypothetical protein